MLAFLLCISVVAGQSTKNFDLNSCRVQLSCGVEGLGTSNPGSVAGRPGKRGPAGPPGPPGSREDSCDCSEKLTEFEDRLKDLEAKKCPQTEFHFSSKQTTDWIRVKQPMPEFTTATTCTWLTPKMGSSSLTGAYLSYATPTQANEFLLFLHSALRVIISGTSRDTPFAVTSRTHVCVAISITAGWAKVFRDGALNANISFPRGKPVEGGGALLIGQEQDEFAGGFVAGESVMGTVENLMMWFRVLDVTEIQTLYNDHCSCPDGYDIALTPDVIQLEGKVATLPVDQC